MTPLTWQAYGADAVLIEFADPAQRWRLACPGATDVVMGATTALVRFDPAQLTASQLMSDARLVDVADRPPAERLIPVRYDGPDLGDVARACGLTIDDFIAQHSAITFRAEFCGFAPGFAYLSGLPDALRLPRRATPRPRVTAGSVAIAGPYCAVYPSASPGGWNVVGTSSLRLFDPLLPEPALIRPGDLVQFEAEPC